MITARPLNRRLQIGVLALALAACSALALGTTRGLLRFIAGEEFPGSTRVSAHTFIRPGLATTIRRDASYYTSAPFNEVYIWYSRTYDLGPAQFGQGTCLMMGRSRTFARVIDYDVGIMVCDTPQGRTSVVSRSVSLRLR